MADAPRVILVHLNIEADPDDTRTADEIADAIVGALVGVARGIAGEALGLRGLVVACPLAEEV